MPVGSNSKTFTGAAARAGARLDAAITDFFLPGDGRLDDSMRAALTILLQRLVTEIEGDIRRHAGRLLAARGHADQAEALLASENAAMPLLVDAGLLRDSDLMAELIARTRGALIADALPVMAEEANRPSLLVRFASLPDSIVAGAARALLAADGRWGLGAPCLPAKLQHRLVWWTAAAVGAALPESHDGNHALAEAAQRCLAAHDEGERPEAVAARLVVAIDPLPAEMPALIVEAMADRRLTLVAALLVRVAGIDADSARMLLIEPDDERLWSALRLAELTREEIARIALSIATADPRRDIDAFADRLDAIMAQTPAEARAAIAPLTLPHELRAATNALARGRR